MDEGQLNSHWIVLQAVSVPVAVLEFPSRAIVFLNDALAALLGPGSSSLLGRDGLAFVPQVARAEAERINDALARGTIDGFHATRGLVRPDGSLLELDVSGRRWQGGSSSHAVWVFTPATGRRLGEEQIARGPVVVALTDHDWQFSHVSTDAELLGCSPSDLLGTSLLGLVHPAGAGGFLAAASAAIEGQSAVTIETRLRSGPDRWTHRFCLLTRMCDHDPPRLGVVITASPGPTGDGDRLTAQVFHAARERHVSDAARALQVLARNPESPDLSARQLEILAHVIQGDGVDKIAASVYLSPSTVRNHLSAIYRKFGVHSRAELLAALLRTVS